MNLLKGYLQQLSPEEEASGKWKSLTGCIVLDNWRPLSYIVLVEDYKDIVLETMIRYNCRFSFCKTFFSLEADPSYKIRVLKIPKFDECNMSLISWALENALGKILKAGGTDYIAMFEELNSLRYD